VNREHFFSEQVLFNDLSGLGVIPDRSVIRVKRDPEGYFSGISFDCGFSRVEGQSRLEAPLGTGEWIGVCARRVKVSIEL
jgi:hypothetical protein